MKTPLASAAEIVYRLKMSCPAARRGSNWGQIPTKSCADASSALPGHTSEQKNEPSTDKPARFSDHSICNAAPRSPCLSRRLDWGRWATKFIELKSCTKNTVLVLKDKLSSGLGGFRRGQSDPVAQLIPPDKLDSQNSDGLHHVSVFHRRKL